MSEAILLGVDILLMWFLASLAVAVWAHQRGHSLLLALVGALLASPLLMGFAVAVIRPRQEIVEQRQMASGTMRRCPYCAEIIRIEARKCRYCKSLVG